MSKTAMPNFAQGWSSSDTPLDDDHFSAMTFSSIPGSSGWVPKVGYRIPARFASTMELVKVPGDKYNRAGDGKWVIEKLVADDDRMDLD